MLHDKSDKNSFFLILTSTLPLNVGLLYVILVISVTASLSLRIVVVQLFILSCNDTVKQCLFSLLQHHDLCYQLFFYYCNNSHTVTNTLLKMGCFRAALRGV